MFGRRPNSDQARICVLGFSANRVWLVSRFLYFVRFREGQTSGGQISGGKCPTLGPSVCLSVRSAVRSSVRTFVCPFVCSSTLPSDCSIRPSVRSSIHPFIRSIHPGRFIRSQKRTIRGQEELDLYTFHESQRLCRALVGPPALQPTRPSARRPPSYPLDRPSSHLPTRRPCSFSSRRLRVQSTTRSGRQRFHRRRASGRQRLQFSARFDRSRPDRFRMAEHFERDTRSAGTTGPSLSVCRSLVDQHGRRRRPTAS